MSYRQLLRAVRVFNTGGELLRDAGGPVTRIQLGPRWLVPPLVLVTSPSGIGDVLARNHALGERCIVHDEVRQLAGDSLWVLPNERWVPRKRALQPVFTHRNVRRFGGHMSHAAQTVVDRWRDAAGAGGGLEVDLDLACRRLTMQSLGRSILGLDLNERGDAIAESMHVASSYAADRALRPVRAPHWLPTPARRRAQAAVAAMLAVADEILQACRADPTRDAPLVHALMAAADPVSGRVLSDDDIRKDLLIFMLAGHDTTATALTYALWALGHHPDVQDRVAAEATAIGNRELVPADVPRLGYTRQVLDESLRLCPPAAGVGRRALQDMAVDGYRVQAGSIVAVGIQAVHRDPAVWDDPTVFDPDRFSPDASRERARWQFVPFAGGPRSCIGEHFAIRETTLALATIVSAVEIRSLDDEFPVEVPYTTVAKGPIRAHLAVR
jgi:cytochrome P450